MIEQNRTKKTVIGIATLILVPLLFFLGYIVGDIFARPTDYISQSQIEREIQEIIENDAMNGRKYTTDEIVLAKLSGMIKLLDDKYAQITYDDGDTYGYVGSQYAQNRKIGITFNFTDNNQLLILDTDISSDAFGKLFPGDLIIGLVNSNGRIDFTKSLSQDTITNLIKSDGIKDSVTFVVKRTTKEINVNVTYKELKTLGLANYSEIDDKTAYIILRDFSTGSAASFKEALINADLQKPDKLILDLRGNPGGDLAELEKIIHMLVKSEKIVFNTENYREKKVNGSISGNITLDVKDYMKNIKILVDENTASAAEGLASVLKIQNNAEIIGRPTYGKDIYQVVYKNISGTKYGLKYTQGFWRYLNAEDKMVRLRDEKILDNRTILDDTYLPDIKLAIRFVDTKVTYQNDLISEKEFLEYKYNIIIDSDEKLIAAIDQFVDELQTNGIVITHETGYYESDVSKYLYTDYRKALNDLNQDAMILYALKDK